MEQRTEKLCKCCGEVKALSEFYKDSRSKDGRYSLCIPCQLTATKSVEMNEERYARRMYTNQRSNSKKRGMLFPDYTFEEFYVHLLNNTQYLTLYKTYIESGRDKELAPSTDRSNHLLPYTFDNIQIITWKENRVKAVEENERENFKIIHYKKNGKIKIYDSIVEASKEIGVIYRHISNSCNYRLRKYPKGIFRYYKPSKDRVEVLSIRLVELLKAKKTPHGNKGEMSEARLQNLLKVQESNRIRCEEENPYAKSKLWKVYIGIKCRLRYGQIPSIHQEWLDNFVSFKDWCEQNGFKEHLALLRINRKLGFSPDNCHWVDLSIPKEKTFSSKKVGFTGVSFNKASGKYKVSIMVQDKVTYLGSFSSEIEGAIAYNNFMIENNVTDRKLNVIPEEYLCQNL